MPSGTAAQILVVDDEAAIRELLVDALSGENVHVTAVADAGDAMRVAREGCVDFVVTDLRLADGSGLDVLDAACRQDLPIPAVLITAHGTPAELAEASRRRPVELMTKPLDIPRLQEIVERALSQRHRDTTRGRRSHRLRQLARTASRQRRQARRQLETACSQLTDRCRHLRQQLELQETLSDFHAELLSARSDDDVFRSLFRAFVRKTGGLFGVAMACNDDAELQVIGRFGVPRPDGMKFCHALCQPAVACTLANPRTVLMDAMDDPEVFPEQVRPYLPGISLLAVPLMPAEGEIIGMAVLYRKGEQPFTDEDIALAEKVGPAAAACLKRNG